MESAGGLDLTQVSGLGRAVTLSLPAGDAKAEALWCGKRQEGSVGDHGLSHVSLLQ